MSYDVWIGTSRWSSSNTGSNVSRDYEFSMNDGGLDHGWWFIKPQSRFKFGHKGLWRRVASYGHIYIYTEDYSKSIASMEISHWPWKRGDQGVFRFNRVGQYDSLGSKPLYEIKTVYHLSERTPLDQPLS
jgi:hypothetical protein